MIVRRILLDDMLMNLLRFKAALAPLDWVNIRGHAALLAAIQKVSSRKG